MNSLARLIQLKGIGQDLSAGLVVFLVALPLCLGIALASNAPVIAGILAGIVGGIVVGALSGSHTSVSGPAAGLAAVVLSQIANLGSFEAFLMAVVFAGILQMAMGLLRAGFIASFFPSSVIKGLLAAIGLILVLKQVPHLFGLDKDYEGEMAFFQHDQENTFSELLRVFDNLHAGSLLIGLLSLLLLICWGRIAIFRKSRVPPQLIVVLLGVGLTFIFSSLGVPWFIGQEHRVLVPVIRDFFELKALFTWPDFSRVADPKIYVAALTLALVASLETLLNLEALDKIDPRKRRSPPNRELFAQGVGNLLLGFLGGLPVTSVVVRGSVNINANAKSKKSSIFHGIFLLLCVVSFPLLLNTIPLSCLAAILITTGFKLTSPKVLKEMWAKGPNQFVPLLVTVLAIVFTDLLVGVCIGLLCSIVFILHHNFKQPISLVKEKRFDNETIRINLGNQVTFLNMGSLRKALNNFSRNSSIIFDATNTNFIDADVLGIIRDFKDNIAPLRGITVSLLGFKARYDLEDQILYKDYMTSDVQKNLTPAQILQVLKDGNLRVREGRRLKRDLAREIEATSTGQFPLAVTLSCIDSRTPVELVFDLGIGDILSVRMAGNVVSERVLGSLEFACAMAGAKLIIVMGHTRCGAISAAIELSRTTTLELPLRQCHNLLGIIKDIQKLIDKSERSTISNQDAMGRSAMEERIVRENVLLSMHNINKNSSIIADLLASGKVDLVGCIYDVTTGAVEFLNAPEMATEQRLSDRTRESL